LCVDQCYLNNQLTNQPTNQVN